MSSADGLRWDLRHVFADPAAARAALEAAVREAEAFVVGDATDPAAVRAALDEHDRAERVLTATGGEWGYAALRLSIDDGDDDARDLIASFAPLVARLRQATDQLEHLYGDLADEVRAAPELAPYRHLLERAARAARHRLEPSAETAFAARADSARLAWWRLYQSTIVGIRTDVRGELRTLDDLRGLLRSEERSLRREAAAARDSALDAQGDLVASCLDAVVADRLAEDRLRGHDDPMAATLLVDEIAPAAVASLLAAIEGRRGLLTRWYAAKAAALGLAACDDADATCPVGASAEVPFAVALAASRAVLGRTGVDAAAVIDDLVARSLIDAEPRAGKAPALFTAPLPEGLPTLVLLSYRDRPDDASGLAHELGHAVHFELAKRGRPWLMVDRAASMAFVEVPSTLAELAVSEHLVEGLPPEQGRALLRGALEGVFELVFRASVMCRFEQDAATLRAGGAALTHERLRAAWSERDAALFGAVAAPTTWAAIPHPFMSRFYNYQYCYAALVALALLGVRRDDPAGFDARYGEVLAAAATRPHRDLLARCGVDVDEPGVWERGLDELERLCELAW